MHIRLCVLREAVEEIMQRFHFQSANVPDLDPIVVNQRRASAEINRRDRERLIHRLDKISGAIDSDTRAERLRKKLTEHNAHVFDSMMLIHLKIPARIEFEIKSAVLREEFQHVIKKRDARGDFVFPRAFKHEPS